MSIKAKLLDDYKQAVKNRDLLRKEILQICRSAVLSVEKDKKKELDDNEIIAIMAREHKKRAETVDELKDRKDIISKYESEMSVIEEYLPKQMSEEEITVVVNNAIDETGAVSPKDLGKVMKAVHPKLKGRADGKIINDIVRRQLSK